MNGQIHDVRNVLIPLISASAGFLAAYLWLTNRPIETTVSPKSSNNAPTSSVPRKEDPADMDETDYTTDSDEEITEDYAKRLQNAKPPSSREECKLVLVVNQELSMTKGKIAAQCG